MKAPVRRSLPHAVRIIGGQWKRSKLSVLDAPGLRPTPDRVRETLFNWLGQDLTGWRCLDAFAGSGALGFEAASRNAAQVVLLERDRGLAENLRQQAQRLGASALCVANVDALAWLARCASASFDLVFIDPPFDSALAAPTLVHTARLLAAGGLAYIEAGRPHDTAALAATGWRLFRSSRAGQVHFALLQRS